ncbi:MAG: glycosyl transferase [Methylobacteriaceae bacterium]|nr:glycosyl transferase [Methylobacteriaceae bacterium]
MPLFPSLLVVAAAAGLTALLILLLTPAMARYAMARPSARGLHTRPTPQGGGIAIMIAVAIVCGLAAVAAGWGGVEMRPLAIALAAAGGLAVLGAIDDIRPLHPAPRFLAQFALVGLVIAVLPQGRLFGDALSPLAQGALLLVAGVWFVNLVNFMDGMDWMTVVEMAPLAVVIAGAAALGAVQPHVGLLALALLGGVIGFAPFNAPAARLFLGDVGSLSIGLIAGYGLACLALSGHLGAALIAPAYYLMDSGYTLAARAARGEKVWIAHRTHFYQRAATGGMSVRQVLARVAALNLLLAALSLAAIVRDDWRFTLAALIVALAGTTATLRRLARGA